MLFLSVPSIGYSYHLSGYHRYLIIEATVSCRVGLVFGGESSYPGMAAALYTGQVPAANCNKKFSAAAPSRAWPSLCPRTLTARFQGRSAAFAAALDKCDRLLRAADPSLRVVEAVAGMLRFTWKCRTLDTHPDDTSIFLCRTGPDPAGRLADVRTANAAVCHPQHDSHQHMPTHVGILSRRKI